MLILFLVTLHFLQFWVFLRKTVGKKWKVKPEFTGSFLECLCLQFFIFVPSLFTSLNVFVFQHNLEGEILNQAMFVLDHSALSNSTVPYSIDPFITKAITFAVINILIALYFLLMEVALFLKAKEGTSLSRMLSFPIYIGQLLFSLFLGAVLLRELAAEGMLMPLKQFMLVLFLAVHLFVAVVNRLWLKQNHLVAITFLGLGAYVFFVTPIFAEPTNGGALLFSLSSLVFSMMVGFVVFKVTHTLMRMRAAKEWPDYIQNIPDGVPFVASKERVVFWGLQGIFVVVYMLIMDSAVLG